MSDCVKILDRCNDVSLSLSLERDYVQDEVDFSVRSAKLLGSIFEINIELAIGLFQWFPLLRCFVHILSPLG